MSKTRRPSAVASFKTDLPEPDQVKKTVAAVSGQDTKPEKKEPVRLRFNTMLDPELRERLAIMAAKQKISIADIIERAILAYLKNE